MEGASGALFLLGNPMSDWFDLTKRALDREVERSNAAVSGAKLRSEVGKLAAEEGKIFAHEGFPSFSAFVERVPGLSVYWRKGRDFLVFPEDRPELLAAVAAGNSRAAAEPGARLRNDLFEALTRLPSSAAGLPFYRVSTDRVQWLAHDVNAESPDGDLLSLPVSSIDGEVGIRRRFVEGHTALNETARTDLVQAVDDPVTPLRQFTAALQRHGLASAWHEFRLLALIETLKDWARKHKLEWRAQWLVSTQRTGEPEFVAETLTESNASSARLSPRDLGTLIASLSIEDMRRISVPLDIVLKLLPSK